jgi:hypothetical protein
MPIILKFSASKPASGAVCFLHFDSGNVHRETFLLAKFLNLRFEDQWKLMWCDVVTVFFSAVLDKQGEHHCYFLLAYL